MNPEDNFVDINRNSWNQRVEIHLNSAFYDQKNFLSGKSTLNSIELQFLNDIRGKKVLHLQCHFGQDSISLSRMGAEVTAVDLSDKAIEKAQQIAQELNDPTKFICCNIYDLPQYLDDKFDIVFTSYGTIGWLPDLDKWAKIISHFLKPNGQFIFAEFHPVVWMFDNLFESVAYNYFNSGPIVETETGTYADRNADIHQTYMTWNHSLSEVFNSLINNNLEIINFQEFDYSPYNCFQNTIEIETNKFRIKHLDNKIPMVFTIVAKKK